MKIFLILVKKNAMKRELMENKNKKIKKKYQNHFYFILFSSV
jgi:hypothetical protein